MRPRSPVLSDAADTSRDAERQILQPPQPFANPYGTVNVPAPTNQNFQRAQRAGLPATGRYGTSKGGYVVSSASVHSGTRTSADEMAAVGYGPKDTRSDNPLISGFPIPGAARRTGPDGQPNARRRK
ncbi:MAG: hypothetical protein ACLP3K_11600 [Candidatus Acidiferrales bacterium]